MSEFQRLTFPEPLHSTTTDLISLTLFMGLKLKESSTPCFISVYNFTKIIVLSQNNIIKTFYGFKNTWFININVVVVYMLVQ